MKPLFTQQLLQQIQLENADKWEAFWEANQAKKEGK
jgi:hypothetical protein